MEFAQKVDMLEGKLNELGERGIVVGGWLTGGFDRHGQELISSSYCNREANPNERTDMAFSNTKCLL